MDHPWIRTTLALCVFAAVFIALTVGSYTRESATVDEPQHLTAGYTALRLRDYRIDPEHPPFLRLWAALPLLAMPDVQLDTNTFSWDAGWDWDFSHQFLYQRNNADHLLYRARFMTVVLGIVLGVLVFFWAQEIFGFWTAAAVLALYSLEPNILAHSSLVTTDLGVTCFIFGAIYFLWRLTRMFSIGNAAAWPCFLHSRKISKFSALTLGPIVLAVLLAYAFWGGAWQYQFGSRGEFGSLGRKMLVIGGIILTLAVSSYAAVWAVYSFHYGPTVPNGDLALLQDHPEDLRSVPVISSVANWFDKYRLLPDTYTRGLILGQVKAQHRSAYFVGEIRRTGWWYYFPAAFLVKTPLTILLLFFCGVILLAKTPTRWKREGTFLFLPLAIFLGIAMTMHLNIGLRHILPIYPFALLISGVTLDEMRNRWSTLVLLAPVAVAAVELAVVYPHCLAFFNQLVGGPKNGDLVLLDSNLDWGQDLKSLKVWMDAHQVERINLGYFGSADPAYYGIRSTSLIGSPKFLEAQVTQPRLPGYVAVSVQNLHGLTQYQSKRNFYAPLLEREPMANIGYSIHVYWVETNWWDISRP